MFEDLIADVEDDEKMILYICERTESCDSIYCLHKEPHGKTELGRPDQPENEEPCDCSQVSCKYHPAIVICKPVWKT